MQPRLARYWNALREKGVRRLVAERYDRHVNHRFLRKVVYPRLVDLDLRELGRRNVERRRRLQNTGPSAMPGKVHVVICVDAEGPNAFASNTTWASVGREVAKVAEPVFRRAHADPAGRTFSVNWFVMDWLGAGDNPSGHDLGFHRILDPYVRWIGDANAAGLGDELHWHYHHIPPGRIDGYNRDWRSVPLYEEILSRRLLERGIWHVLYRAGNTWEDEVCSLWLERFFPFDLSSRGPHRNVHYDWSRAPRDWILYHPAPDDVQRPGTQRRWMGRSVDIEKGGFRDDEIEQAFLDAAEGRDSYLSFYMHDFRPMSEFIADGVQRIRAAAARYPYVSWKHTGGVELFRTLGRIEQPEPGMQLRVERKDGDVIVEATRPPFGEPWIAVEDDLGFHRVDATSRGPLVWGARLPATTRRVAAAASDSAGNACIAATT